MFLPVESVLNHVICLVGWCDALHSERSSLEAVEVGMVLLCGSSISLGVLSSPKNTLMWRDGVARVCLICSEVVPLS